MVGKVACLTPCAVESADASSRVIWTCLFGLDAYAMRTRAEDQEGIAKSVMAQSDTLTFFQAKGDKLIE